MASTSRLGDGTKLGPLGGTLGSQPPAPGCRCLLLPRPHTCYYPAACHAADTPAMRPAAGSSNNLQAMHLGPLPSPASNLTPAQQQQLARQQAEMAATGATRPIPQQQQQQLYTMQQMMIHQQLAAQQLTGRAPSPGGGPMVSAGNGSMVRSSP